MEWTGYAIDVINMTPTAIQTLLRWEDQQGVVAKQPFAFVDIHMTGDGKAEALMLWQEKTPPTDGQVQNVVTQRNVSTLLRQQRVGISVVGLASRAVLFGCGGQPPRPWDFLRHALGCPRVVVG